RNEGHRWRSRRSSRCGHGREPRRGLLRRTPERARSRGRRRRRAPAADRRDRLERHLAGEGRVMSERAWILLPSGKQLDLLDPDPWAWTDDDLAIGLSRTYRWAGYSAWDLPLSVAQHSLAVLILRRSRFAERPLSVAEARRELLHDATEALMG